ncbi:hypothetical protein Tco_0154685 [Tanacetum coccineum]
MLEKIFNSELLKFSNFNFKKYISSKTQPFKDKMISDMDFIEKYMLETILHQQKIQKLLTEKKLLQTQEVQINTIQALNVNSVVIENNVSGNENTYRADIRPTYDNNSSEQLDNNDYNVFSMEKEHPEQPEFVNDTYLVDQADTNTTAHSSNMSNKEREPDQDNNLQKERELLASLIEQLKCEIDDCKNQNKLFESLNKAFKEETKN